MKKCGNLLLSTVVLFDVRFAVRFANANRTRDVTIVFFLFILSDLLTQIGQQIGQSDKKLNTNIGKNNMKLYYIISYY